MTLLHQQELLAPPPSRRIIVPRGHTAVWGVDPSTVRVSIAGIGSAGRWVVTRPFARVAGVARLSEVYRQVYEAAGELCGREKPGLVWIEQPSGKIDNPQLSYAVGVTQAALYDGVRDACGVAVEVETVTSSAWKKRAVGRGNVFKPKRGSVEEYGVLVWARENGYVGTSWDEADALGIATAAHREVLLEPR